MDDSVSTNIPTSTPVLVRTTSYCQVLQHLIAPAFPFSASSTDGQLRDVPKTFLGEP